MSDYDTMTLKGVEYYLVPVKDMKPKKRRCKGCSKDISHMHPNAKFHSKKCKDDYWNDVNPRGYGLRDDDCDFSDPSWDAHECYVEREPPNYDTIDDIE